MGRFIDGFIRVMRREAGRIVNRPMNIAFGIIIPVAMQLFMFFMFSEGTARDLPVAICDLDGSQLSREITRKIDAAPSAKVQYRITDIATGHTMLRRKETYALVIIPAHLEQDTLRGLSPSVICYYNNIYLMPATLVYKDVRDAVGSVSSHMKTGNLMRSGMMEARARGLAAPITIDSHRLFNPYTNYHYFLSGGFMPTVFQMLLIITCIITMGFELKEGTAGEWLDAAGGNTAAALSGKLFPYTVCFTITGIFMVTMLLRYAGVPLRGKTGFIFLALFLFILACQAAGIFLTGTLANLRLALSAGSGYTAIAFTYSGVTFPTIGMPVAVRYIGEIIPLTHYLRIFISQSMRGAPLLNVLPSFACLALFLAIPFLMMPRWHSLLREDKYWGRL